MKYLPLIALLLCSCSSSDLPPGTEIARMNTGWYLRTNGVMIMSLPFQTREEAMGVAWMWAGKAKSALADPNHIKVDATLSQDTVTNMVEVTYTNMATPVPKQAITTRVWIEFMVRNYPFKGLVMSQTVTNL